MFATAVTIRNQSEDDIATDYSPFEDAMLNAARAHDFWFDLTRDRPCVLVDGAPVPVSRPCRDGQCPRSMNPSIRRMVDTFKDAVLGNLAPSRGANNSRRLMQYATMLARQGPHSGAHGLAETFASIKLTGPCELAWRLAGISDACQRPPLTGLESAFDLWVMAQVPGSDGALVVVERQARADVERVLGEEVSLRTVRRVARWNGFRLVHGRSARLLIRR